MFSNPREEGIPGRNGIVEKTFREVFNGTGCGNTRGNRRAGKKSYGFWAEKYYKQNLTERCIKFILEDWLE